MFTSFRAALLFASSLCLAAGAATAQDFVIDPANLPPADYRGDSFVDANGCIFLRAGFDGSTTWVPRVTRSREPICGQTPTFADAEPVAVPEPVEQIAEPQTAPAPAPVTPEPEPAPQVVTAPEPEPEPAPVPTPPRTATVDAAPVVAPSPRASTPAPPVRAQAAVVAPRVSRPAVQEPARAIPAPTVSRVPVPPPSQPARGVISIPPGAWIVPSHVYDGEAGREKPLPEGFRPAWEDDRLSPYRAWQRPEGFNATQQLWSNTVPRQETGAERIVRPVPVRRSTGPAPGPEVRTGASAQRFEPLNRDGGVVSTAAPATIQTAPRYLSIGVFTTQARADAAANRLRAAGLPVRFGTHNRGGVAMRAVLVGPFGSDADFRDGIRRTRAAGYAVANIP